MGFKLDFVLKTVCFSLFLSDCLTETHLSKCDLKRPPSGGFNPFGENLISCNFGCVDYERTIQYQSGWAKILGCSLNEACLWMCFSGTREGFPSTLCGLCTKYNTHVHTLKGTYSRDRISAPHLRLSLEVAQALGKLLLAAGAEVTHPAGGKAFHCSSQRAGRRARPTQLLCDLVRLFCCQREKEREKKEAIVDNVPEDHFTGGCVETGAFI